MATDPRSLIDERPMSSFQWGVVAIMIGLNALDGFDVLSISFASPGIAQDWGIDRAALGIVLSMELIGMSIGALLLGSAADRLGRRKMILFCLIVMSIGMFGAATSRNVIDLCSWRVLTGLGIGGMLATTNAAVSEVSNNRWRSLAVVLMAAGYPVGAVIGGWISSQLLISHEWQAVFIFGGIATTLFIPLVMLRAPESIAFELQRRSTGATERINHTLGRMGHPSIEMLPEAGPPTGRTSLGELFSNKLIAITSLLTIAYLAHIMTFYFILKWIPKIIVDMDFAASSAGQVLVIANVGGAVGALLLGLLTTRVRLLTLTIAAMLLSVGLVIIFGQGQEGYLQLCLVAAATGFCTNAGVVGLYGLIAQNFPTRVRASATGFVIGIGRGGSAAAPAIAGILFQNGYGLPTVALLMAMGSLIAAFALMALGIRLARG